MAAALVSFLALKDAGYDIVVRQEVFLVAWWALALGVAFGVLPRASPHASYRLVICGLLAAVSFGALSLIWTGSAELTIDEIARDLGYAGLICLVWLSVGRDTWRAAACGLFVGAMAVCVLALGSRLSPNVLPLDQFDLTLQTPRLFQPFGYWNALATWSAMAVVMSLAWSVDARRTQTRAAALAFAPIGFIVLYLTYSRGGVVELAIGLAVVLALCRNRTRAGVHVLGVSMTSAAAILVVRSQGEIAQGAGDDGALLVAGASLVAAGTCWAIGRATRRLGIRAESGTKNRHVPRLGRRSRFAAVAAAVGLAVLAILVVAAGRDGLGARGDTAAFDSDDPASRFTTVAGNRSAYWSEALRAFGDQPLRGTGPGTFRYGWAKNGSEPELVVDAHSMPLELLAERGLLGLLAFVVAFVGLAVAARHGFLKAAGEPAAVAMAGSFVVYLISTSIDWIWEATAVTVLGLGSVVVLAAAGSDHRFRRERLGSRGRWSPALIAIAAASIAAGAVQIPGVVATEHVRDAQVLVHAGDLEAAQEAATDAITAAPWTASPFAARGELELRLGDLSAARRSALTAVEHESEEPAHRLLLARIAFEQGDEIEAHKQLTIARELAPLTLGGVGNASEELQERLLP
ncbi:MAG: hypothetical protein QOI31_2340 [Solirubrobacterales bacterium]|jgi:hypothetical protein|nr:hypothetical protein [Solirubrobacterales bacterium]